MTNEVTVRLGSVRDVPAIVKLQAEHQLKDWSNLEGRNGFLISGYSATEVEELVQSDGFVLIATSQEHRPVGYLIATSGQSYQRRHPTTAVVWESREGSREIVRTFDSGAFTYLDQVAVAREFSGQGVGTSLLRAALAKNVRSLLFSAVIDKPWRNERSHRVFEKAGFVAVGRLVTPNYRGFASLESTLFVAGAGGL